MEQKSFFTTSRQQFVLILLILFGTALAIRAYDITDLPLDFHPTRQLFSAMKARGLYYAELQDAPGWQRQMARQQAKTKVTVEPELIEQAAAFTYRFTGEQVWIPRLYSAMFWLAGGIFLFLLARDLVSTDGAFLSLTYYLLLPYGVYASRSFQPDPLMVTLILAFWWLVFRWADLTPGPSPFRRGETWKYAILAGLVGGLAIFVKFVAAFFVIGGALGAALGRFKLHEIFRKPQVWTMAILGVIPGAAWVVYGVFVAGFLGKQFGGRFIPSLLASPSFYLSWQNMASAAAGGVWITLGLLGLFLVRGKPVRVFLFGLWGAYLVFGLYFNYHISTHDYYSLPLIPIVALSLASIGDGFFARLTGASSKSWGRSAAYVILIFGLFSSVWAVRNEMKTVDYRPEQAMWEKISQAMGPNASVAALTEDYGLRLAFWGWQNAESWPTSGDLYQAEVRGGKTDINKLFDEVAERKIFFVVTDFKDLARQPELGAQLKGYPVWAQGEGYIIYDLYHPLEAE